jgi:hypothetical protein
MDIVEKVLTRKKDWQPGEENAAQYTSKEGHTVSIQPLKDTIKITLMRNGSNIKLELFDDENTKLRKAVEKAHQKWVTESMKYL